MCWFLGLSISQMSVLQFLGLSVCVVIYCLKLHCLCCNFLVYHCVVIYCLKLDCLCCNFLVCYCVVMYCTLIMLTSWLELICNLLVYLCLCSDILAWAYLCFHFLPEQDDSLKITVKPTFKALQYSCTLVPYWVLVYNMELHWIWLILAEKWGSGKNLFCKIRIHKQDDILSQA